MEKAFGGYTVILFLVPPAQSFYSSTDTPFFIPGIASVPLVLRCVRHVSLRHLMGPYRHYYFLSGLGDGTLELHILIAAGSTPGCDKERNSHSVAIRLDTAGAQYNLDHTVSGNGRI